MSAVDPEMDVMHACPADGSIHENSPECACGPVRVSDNEWRHHSEKGEERSDGGDTEMTPMEQAATEPYNVDSLSPVPYLLMETLAARRRLGERVWTFPTHCISERKLDALLTVGLIGWKRGVEQGSYIVWLTGEGERSVFSGTYVPPLLADLQQRIEAEIGNWRHEVVEDCWYTCPAATEEREGETCCNDAAGTECNCGLEHRRDRVRAVVAAYAAEVAR